MKRVKLHCLINYRIGKYGGYGYGKYGARYIVW